MPYEVLERLKSSFLSIGELHDDVAEVLRTLLYKLDRIKRSIDEITEIDGELSKYQLNLFEKIKLIINRTTLMRLLFVDLPLEFLNTVADAIFQIGRDAKRLSIKTDELIPQWQEAIDSSEIVHGKVF